MAKSFWGEAVNIACHILNRVHFRLDTKKTPYELWRGKKPVVKYFRIFGSECYILQDHENLEKFDPKIEKGIFLGYSTSSRAYKVYNLKTKAKMEPANVVINDEKSTEDHSKVIQETQNNHNEVEDTLPKEHVNKVDDQELQILNDAVLEPTTSFGERIQEQGDGSTPTSQNNTSTSLVKGPSTRIKLNHPITNILGSLNDNMQLRSKALNVITHSYYLSQIEPKKVDEALQDTDCINSMHEKLHQFIRNDLWDMVPRPQGVNVIGTKWIFKNMLDEHGIVIRNKSKLVAQGYTQVERVDFDETFALVVRIESIRILLAIVCHLNFKLFQMEVKSAFLNGMLQEVYVE